MLKASSDPLMDRNGRDERVQYLCGEYYEFGSMFLSEWNKIKEITDFREIHDSNICKGRSTKKFDNSYLISFQDTFEGYWLAYIIAHEICHCGIWEDGFPIFRNDMHTSVAHKGYERFLNQFNTLIYDPFVDIKLEGYGFNLSLIYEDQSNGKPTPLSNDLPCGRYMKILFYATKRLAIERYCKDIPIQSNTFLTSYLAMHPKIVENGEKIASIMKSCRYNDPDEVIGLAEIVLDKFNLRLRKNSDLLFVESKI
jgi:hypothetical protein